MNFLWKGNGMRQHSALPIILVGLLLAGLAGCEIGTNPIILDGAPAAQTLRVDNSANFFAGTGPVALSEIFNGVDNEIDSVKVFNVTMLIDSTAGTTGGTVLTGLLLINTDTLFTLNGTPLSAFSAERTIFDPTLAQAGFTYSTSTLMKLQHALNQKPQPTVTLTFGGIASNSPIHFSAHFTLYTQFFTRAQN
jgi:hypothetical protein